MQQLHFLGISESFATGQMSAPQIKLAHKFQPIFFFVGEMWWGKCFAQVCSNWEAGKIHASIFSRPPNSNWSDLHLACIQTVEITCKQIQE